MQSLKAAGEKGVTFMKKQQGTSAAKEIKNAFNNAFAFARRCCWPR